MKKTRGEICRFASCAHTTYPGCRGFCGYHYRLLSALVKLEVRTWEQIELATKGSEEV